MRRELSAVSKHALRAALVVATLAPLAACTTQQRQGTGSSYLIINSIEAKPGSDPSKTGNVLESDAVTYVKTTVNGEEIRVPTIFEDSGLVTFSLGMKDPGLEPSTTNFITINRYRVEFIRADGRNTPGVDVPYPFDGAFTATVSDTAGGGGGFTLVRIQAKNEAPLKTLVGGGSAFAISTIARVTFYGQDQAGHEVSATGQISVNFADWGDPD